MRLLCDEPGCGYSTADSSNIKKHKATHAPEVDLFVNVKKFRIHYSFLLFRSVFFAMNLDVVIPPLIFATLKGTKQRMSLAFHARNATFLLSPLYFGINILVLLQTRLISTVCLLFLTEFIIFLLFADLNFRFFSSL